MRSFAHNADLWSLQRLPASIRDIFYGTSHNSSELPEHPIKPGVYAHIRRLPPHGSSPPRDQPSVGAHPCLVLPPLPSRWHPASTMIPVFVQGGLVPRRKTAPHQLTPVPGVPQTTPFASSGTCHPESGD